MTNIIPIEASRVARWVRRINDEYANGVQAIIRVGQLLIEAKAECSHGEWGEITGASTGKPLLPFSQQTASRFMSISRNKALTNYAHVRILPASWGTLYELTKLPDDELERHIAEGRITPDMQRKDAVALLETWEGKQPRTPTERPPRAEPTPQAPMQPPPGMDWDAYGTQLDAEIAEKLDEHARKEAEYQRREASFDHEWATDPERQAWRLWNSTNNMLKAVLKDINIARQAGTATHIPASLRNETAALWAAIGPFINEQLENSNE